MILSMVLPHALTSEIHEYPIGNHPARQAHTPAIPVDVRLVKKRPDASRVALYISPHVSP